jgi:hypothetical protein
MAKDYRKARRSKMGAKAWVRLDGGFSVRPCVIDDRSSTGVQLTLDSTLVVARNFTLLTTRDARQGQPCCVKWRRGSRLGAEFV